MRTAVVVLFEKSVWEIEVHHRDTEDAEGAQRFKPPCFLHVLCVCGGESLLFARSI